MQLRGSTFARRQKKRATAWWMQSGVRSTLWQRRAAAARFGNYARRRVTGSTRPIVVCFVVTRATTWRLDKLYWLLDDSSDFVPYVLVSQLHEDAAGHEFRACLDFVRERGYRQPPRDPINAGLVLREWLKRVDAIFYDLPYDHYHVDERLQSKNFPYAFHGYLPYGLRVIDVTYVDWEFPTVLNCTRYYCETEWHRQYNVRRSPRVGRRSVVTGLPTTFRILEDSRAARETPATSMVTADGRKPRLLWAPHWSWALSTRSAWAFIRYHVLLCKLAREGKIELWYRPHPLLDVRLKRLGSQQFRADHVTFPVGTPFVGAEDMDYVELFAHVDLIVHNSGSFLSEYIATGKPAVFITDESFIQANLGDFGKRAIAASYQVASEKELEDILRELLEEGCDPLTEARLDFASYLDEQMPVDPCEVIAADLEGAFRGGGN